MNTKQVEELTGISRQNIRFYEKIGLLHPGRIEGNSYRDYGKEDVDRLQMIKLLRMLDMSTEEIAQIFAGNISLEEAVSEQQKILQQRERQLQGAIEICGRIAQNTHEDNFLVGDYLRQVEYEQNKVGGFAQFKEDYKKVVTANYQRQFSFVVPHLIHTVDELIQELESYSKDEDWDIQKKKDQTVQVVKEGQCYVISSKRLRNKPGENPSTVIMGTLVHPEQAADVTIPAKRKKILYSIHIVQRNIRRHKWKSLLTIGVCAMTMLLLAVYLGMMGNLQEQTEQLPQTMTIRGAVYNLNGSKNTGLLIKDLILRNYKKSGYLADYTETAELFATTGFGREDYVQITGVSDRTKLEEAVTNLVTSETALSMENFGQKEDTCFMEQGFMDKHKLRIGDCIPMKITYLTEAKGLMRGTLTEEPLLQASVRITGSYQWRQSTSGEGMAQVYVSTKQIRDWYLRAQKDYTASSFSFTLKDPLQLNAFKEAMDQVAVKEVNPTADNSYEGKAMVLNDGAYIEAATQLARSLNMMKSFYPLIVLIIIMIGGIVSYLLLYSRRMEASIMRTMGTGRRQTIVLFMLEQVVLAVVGCGMGLLLAWVLGLHASAWYMTVVYFLSYLGGAMVSLEGISRNNIAATLTGKE